MIRIKVSAPANVRVGTFNGVFLQVKISPIIRAAPESMEIYDGPYSVTPTVQDQILATAQRYMRDDITVTAIPYAEVSNASNGKTVTIA